MSDERPSGVDDLIDRAIAALNRGDVDRAHALAGEVLATEAENLDAGDLLAAEVRPEGEIRRLTVMFCDMVGSTEMSARLEPETYHSILMRYQRLCRTVVVQQFEGSIVSVRGDGILATFGFPVPHENDVDRALLAGLELLAEVDKLAADVARQVNEKISVRVAVHKGVVFLDRDAGDLYGFAVNVAARLESLAEPGTLVVSDEVRRLVSGRFDLEAHEPRLVKGVDTPLAYYTVLGQSMVRAIAGPEESPLVGRAAELETLRAAWEQARVGERVAGSCVAIVGESGMGKTRLAAALCEEVVEGGDTVVELVASPLHEGHGLWPVKQLIEQRSGVTRHSTGEDRLQRLVDTAAELGMGGDSVPLLAALLGLDPQVGYAPVESDARRLSDQVSEAAEAFVSSCLGDTPALLICDDAQWFDEATSDLVARLVRARRPSTAVVLTSRDAAAVPRGDGTTLLQLEVLSEDDRMQLMHAIGGDELTPEALDRVANRSDGIPLYLEELLRAELQAPAELAMLEAPGDASQDADTVPDVLYEPLVARLHVSANGASVASAVATIGREVDSEVLARVTDLDPDDLNEALTSLLGALILERAGTEDTRYRFRHELVRAVAYDLQPPSRRRDLHGRVADALLGESVDGVAVDWAVVAGHYQTAGRALDSADAYERASAIARGRGALAEARMLLGRAIEVVAAAPEDLDQREADLRLRRGFLAVSLEGNSSAEAAADYERCLELSIDKVESDTIFSTLTALWSYYCSRGQFDRAQELIDVLQSAAKGRRRAMGFVTAGGGGLVAVYRGNYSDAVVRCEEAVAWSSSYSDTSEFGQLWFVPLDPIMSTHTMLATARLVTGDIAGTQAQFEAARAVALSLPFPQGPFSLAAYLSFEVWLKAELDDLDGAEASLADLAEVSGRHGFDQWSIVAMTQRTLLDGHRALREGDTAALSACAAAIGGNLMMWKMTDTWVFVTYYMTMQGIFHAAAGEPEQALAAFQESSEIAARTGMFFYEAENVRHRAALEADVDTKRAQLVGAAALAVDQGAVVFELRAAADLADLTGDLEPMRAALAKFRPDASYPELDAARARVTG